MSVFAGYNQDEQKLFLNVEGVKLLLHMIQKRLKKKILGNTRVASLLSVRWDRFHCRICTLSVEPVACSLA